MKNDEKKVSPFFKSNKGVDLISLKNRNKSSQTQNSQNNDTGSSQIKKNVDEISKKLNYDDGEEEMREESEEDLIQILPIKNNKTITLKSTSSSINSNQKEQQKTPIVKQEKNSSQTQQNQVKKRKQTSKEEENEQPENSKTNESQKKRKVDENSKKFDINKLHKELFLEKGTKQERNEKIKKKHFKLKEERPLFYLPENLKDKEGRRPTDEGKFFFFFF